MFDLTDDYSNQTIQYNDGIENKPSVYQALFVALVGFRKPAARE